jgi:2-amino-4-hydroxy-6-hydroxymethyldihydropteridine diphosphokinase
MQEQGLEIVAVSSLWKSRAWPDPSEPDYVNAVIVARTPMEPRALLDFLHGLEDREGRRRDRLNQARRLDLDLIDHGGRVLEESLVLPHPRAAARLFVMGPLAEIDPEWRHPVLERSAKDLARAAEIGRDAHPFAPLTI